jgi:CubicO group peptidase (beta-lactamase class C family)
MLAVAAAAIGIIASNPARLAAADPGGEALATRLDAIAAQNQVVGFAIGMISDGERIRTHAYGEVRLGSGSTLSSRSIFHWASVSKPFVAIAIMQLKEQGKLDLDARLVDILPDYETSDERHGDVTIRQLLLHTAGMPDVHDYEWDKPQHDDQALRRWALSESPRDLLFDPGADRRYSNVGYEILGVVIEQVSKESFEDYMQAHIFTPLGMSATTFYYPDVPEQWRTTGHAGEADRQPTQHYPYNRRHAPSSTLNSNIEDMARFAIALLNGGELDGKRILRAETVREMWTPGWTINESPMSAMALGWVVEDFNGHRAVRHFGGDDGFRSVLILFPDDQAGVFMVTNDEETPRREIVLTALAELLGSPLPAAD